MLFPTADALTINNNWNIAAPRQLVRQLQYIVFLYNFMIAQ